MKHWHLYAALVEFWLQLLVSFASGAPPCYVPVKVLAVTDCDTIKADALLPWGVTLRDRTFRLDFDAHEVSRIRQTVEVTDEEIAKGKVARDELAALVAKAEAVYVQPTGEEYGAYNRLSASLWIKPKDGELIDVRKWAIERGHVRAGK